MLTTYPHDRIDLGYPPLDKEHLAFFKTIQLADRAAQEEDFGAVSLVFEKCYDYARQHFVHEEKLMEQMSFPQTDAHIKSHAVFIKNISEMREQFEYAPVAKEKTRIAVWLAHFLEVWFLGHIMSRDSLLKPYLAKLSEKQSDGKTKR
jgi:hemerythrin